MTQICLLKFLERRVSHLKSIFAQALIKLCPLLVFNVGMFNISFHFLWAPYAMSSVAMGSVTL